MTIVRNGVYRNVEGQQVAKGGVIRRVQRALVACGGTAIEFHPRTAVTEDQIFFTSTEIDTVEIEASPNDAESATLFEVASGKYYWAPTDGVTQSDYFLRPPTDNTGQFLIRADLISQSGGLLIGPPTGVWDDIHVNGPLYNWSWRLNQSGVGIATMELDISIAQDDGAGNPLAGTTVVKRVNYFSQVGTDALSWSAVPWAIEELKVNQTADCVLRFENNGSAFGEGDTSGNFTESWSDGPQANYTVQVDVVSGTPPSGDALGVPLTLDLERSWNLTANADEDLSCELDVTVTDELSNFVVKRVTMHSQHTFISDDLAWTTDQINFQVETPTDQTVEFILKSDTNGLANIDGSDPAIPIELPWHNLAPNPPDSTDYETRLRVLSGISPNNGIDPDGVWLNAGSVRTWRWQIFPDVDTKTLPMAVEWGYRRLGQPSTEILKIVVLDSTGGA
jgi:hypothetical protein